MASLSYLVFKSPSFDFIAVSVTIAIAIIVVTEVVELTFIGESYSSRRLQIYLIAAFSFEATFYHLHPHYLHAPLSHYHAFLSLQVHFIGHHREDQDESHCYQLALLIFKNSIFKFEFIFLSF